MFQRFIFSSVFSLFILVLSACSAGNEPDLAVIADGSTEIQLDEAKSSSLKTLLKSKFNNEINQPILQECVKCHVSDGLAASTRLILKAGVADDIVLQNSETLSSFPDATLFLNKSSNKVIHAGSTIVIVDESSSQYTSLNDFFNNETRYFIFEEISIEDNKAPIPVVAEIPDEPVEVVSPVTGASSLNSTLIQTKCLVCHNATGIAKNTRLLFEQGEAGLIQQNNESKIRDFIRLENNTSQLLLEKPIGVNHLGGTVLVIDSIEYGLLETFVNQSISDDAIAGGATETLNPPVESAPTNPVSEGPVSNESAPIATTPSVPETNISSINLDVIQVKCIACHNSTGAAKNTALVFLTGNSNIEIVNNETQITDFISISNNAVQLILDKPRGLNHGGGEVLALGSVEYNLLENFVNQTEVVIDDVINNPIEYTLETSAQTYRRASLYLSGEIPSRQKVLSMQNADDETLRSEILALMQGEGFHQFITNAANNRIHSRQVKTTGSFVSYFNKFYKPNANEDETLWFIRKNLAEEPLELIAYVIENNLPYSEILTADYVMVSQYTDEAYNTGLDLQEGEWKPVKNTGQDIKTNDTFYLTATGENRISDLPHAGILSSWAYLSRYNTSATNRNRARAAWTMRHFLGFDVETSVTREVSAADVADEENPTLNNPACTACHDIMDPVASAFKYYGTRIGYKTYGTDSLDRTYRKENPGVDWYQDILDTGFYGNTAPDTVDPLQWLAKKITDDDRFASAAVKFWWPALFGEDILNSDAPRIQFDAQSLLINQLADKFRPQLNLKELLADMIMSDAFRVNEKFDESIADDEISLQGSGKHLLDNDQLINKTRSLTGFVWNEKKPNLNSKYYALYGGTDDLNVDDRPENISTIMYRVAESHAYNLSCAIVVYDFDFIQSERRLFTKVERDTLDETKIRQQIVVLYERLLNRFVNTISPEVSDTYELFLNLRQARVNQGNKTRIDAYTRCDNRKSGSTDDQYFVLGPWRAIIMAFMSDIDYLYE